MRIIVFLIVAIFSFCAALLLGAGAYYATDVIGGLMAIDNPEYFTLLAVIIFAGLMASTRGNSAPDMTGVEGHLGKISNNTDPFNPLFTDEREGSKDTIEALNKRLEHLESTLKIINLNSTIIARNLKKITEDHREELKESKSRPRLLRGKL